MSEFAMDISPASAGGSATIATATLHLIDFELSYSGSKHIVTLPENATVFELKDEIESLLSISPGNQKLIGGGLPAKVADETVLSSLPLKRVTVVSAASSAASGAAASSGAGVVVKLMLMGTPDSVLQKHRDLMNAAAAEAEAAVQNDLELDEEGGDSAAGWLDAVATNPLHLQRIQRRIQTYKPKVMAGFRSEVKKTLVLDIDYTLIDHRSTVQHPLEMARPYLHEFLTAAYPHYNIVIWSATSMKWIELKMSEMGVSTHPDFKIACYLDHGAMITVNAPHYGVVDCKPLPVLWGLFPGLTSPPLTIMFDDLNRNFLMNRANGLRIAPCRSLPTTRHLDTELLGLSHYLIAIAHLDTFEGLRHKKWKRYLGKHEAQQLEQMTRGNGSGSRSNAAAGAGAGSGTGGSGRRYVARLGPPAAGQMMPGDGHVSGTGIGSIDSGHSDTAADAVASSAMVGMSSALPTGTTGPADVPGDAAAADADASGQFESLATGSTSKRSRSAEEGGATGNGNDADTGTDVT